MLYIFDMGNVIIDIDFKRVLGVWSKLSGTSFAILNERFCMGDIFQQHERGTISDESFARQFCDEMGLSLSFEQFDIGWQAVFVELRSEVINIMHKLRHEGHRVVILSNTNNLHFKHWSRHYSEVIVCADQLYLSHKLGMRKPEAEIYQHVLASENYPAEQVVFFDDIVSNIAAAQILGINAVHVTDKNVIPSYFIS